MLRFRNILLLYRWMLASNCIFWWMGFLFLIDDFLFVELHLDGYSLLYSLLDLCCKHLIEHWILDLECCIGLKAYCDCDLTTFLFCAGVGPNLGPGPWALGPSVRELGPWPWAPGPGLWALGPWPRALEPRPWALGPMIPCPWPGALARAAGPEPWPWAQALGRHRQLDYWTLRVRLHVERKAIDWEKDYR